LSGRDSRRPGRRYAVITPARDEVDNLPALAESIVRQSEQPATWVIVDNGSTDGTIEFVRSLEERHAWVHLLEIPGETAAVRAAPVVRAFEAGLQLVEAEVEYVANQDADITFPPGYFAGLMDAFEADPALGITGGVCYERNNGRWANRYVTGTTVWGGSRLYRRRCLDDVLPLEPRLGWDGMAEAKANMRGWTTKLQPGLPFLHHRPEGSRDSSQWSARVAEGRSSHYMGYRPWYLALRAVRHAVTSPSALGLLWGYAKAGWRREPTCADASVRAYVRRQQHPGRLPARLRETRGRGKAH
jgi:poly-beta-1,6-N-acetyl-D-glucosamine synthase